MQESQIPITVNIVVESQLFVFLDVSLRVDAHSDVLADCPFRNKTIRITTVVGESTNSSTLRCIDELHTDGWT